MADALSTGTRLIRQLLGKPVPPVPGRIPAMLAARRQMVDAPYIQKFDGVDLPDGGWMPTKRHIRAKPIARDGTVLGLEEEAALGAAVSKLLVDNPGFQGVYDPNYWLVVYPDASQARAVPGAYNTRRHEVMHGLNHAAMLDGRGLPLSARLTAALRSSGEQTYAGQLGRVMDELVAQRAGGASFSRIPWGAYSKYYAKTGSPVSARIAGGLGSVQRAGRAAVDRAPYLTGGAVSAGLIGYELLRPNNPPQEKK